MVQFIKPAPAGWLGYVEDYFSQANFDYSSPNGDQITFFINSATGNDAFFGVSEDKPLATIQRALDIGNRLVWKSGLCKGVINLELFAGGQRHTVAPPPNGGGGSGGGGLWPAINAGNWGTIWIYCSSGPHPGNAEIYFASDATSGASYELAACPGMQTLIDGVDITYQNNSHHPINATYPGTHLLLAGTIKVKVLAGNPLSMIGAKFGGFLHSTASITFDCAAGRSPDHFLESRGNSGVVLEGSQTILGTFNLPNGFAYVSSSSIQDKSSGWTAAGVTGPRFTDLGGMRAFVPGASLTFWPGNSAGTLQSGSVFGPCLNV